MAAHNKTPGGGDHSGAERSKKSPAIISLKLSIADIERQFLQAMRDASIVTDGTIIADGHLHRFHVEGDKRLTRNGWYVLYGDGVPAGEFGSWKSGGVSYTWRADHDRELTVEERDQQRQRIEQARAARAAALAAEREQARRQAATAWSEASPTITTDRPYLIAKGVRAYGIRHRGACLLVPLRDTDGVLHGLQYIAPDGSKKFGIGTAKAGHYHSIGAKPADVLAVVEGYATGATVHMATGWPVAVAFDAGNLLPVVRTLRAKYPSVLLLICADNDRNTDGNPGLTKARAAAAAIGGIVIAPAFSADSAGTDWNDHAREFGIEATARQLVGVLREVRHVA